VYEKYGHDLYKIIILHHIKIKIFKTIKNNILLNRRQITQTIDIPKCMQDKNVNF